MYTGNDLNSAPLFKKFALQTIKSGVEMDTELDNLNAILNRLARLERQNRIFKHLGLVLVAGLLVLGTTAWRVADQYRDYNGQFFLRDAYGNMRGGFGYDSKTYLGQLFLGSPGAHTGPRRGEFRPKLDMVLRYDENQLPELRIYDKNETTRGILGFSDDTKTCNLWLYDANGKEIWSAIK